jgi:hypothetical protein
MIVWSNAELYKYMLGFQVETKDSRDPKALINTEMEKM